MSGSNHQYYTYILASHSTEPALYIGVTNDLERRVFEHRNHLVAGYTERYNCDKLVYFEVADAPDSAIAREKQLKRWRREWKLNLIHEVNPDMRDLSKDFV